MYVCVQDEATELVVFVLHSLRNKRETHMMGGSGGDEDDDEGDDVSDSQVRRHPHKHAFTPDSGP